ncbi:ATP-binding protein [Amphritea opalescens]|uniref:ATP-binding protein n=1 Tax=Amphritea opalescens TaxID=2490544 RepID=A0A430KU25_9GAMM|nr:ATP-binding protein [Amphritea opalescens]RTE66990.1 ATP-binding protein [Amphritea opalescens]
MKKKTVVKASIVNKKCLRAKRSKLKAKLRNCEHCSWEVLEKAKQSLDKVKFPHHRVTRSNNYSSNTRVTFRVPGSIDYYHKDNYELTNSFLEDVRDCALRANRRIYLNFSDTQYISAAAMLSFLAEIDVITKKSRLGVRAVSFNHPKDPKMESILKQVGFYDLLKKETRKTKEYDDVTFWKYTSGACSEPILAKDMIADIKNELERSASKKLYRGFVEAMSNSVEHAYIDDNIHCEADNTAKWWTFAGIRDSELVVVICDKGVGIPLTLPKTQGASQIEELFDLLGFEFFKAKDSTYIQAASSLSRTRTGKSYRGKGLTDMKQVIDSIGTGFMSISSNYGKYMYKGTEGMIKEVTIDHKRSVSGTIVEWVIPLKVDIQ